MNNISVSNLTKAYKSTIALDNISFSFKPNSINALLGRNGAGKTTVLDIITNRIIPTSGLAFMDEENLYENDKLLSNISFTSEKLLSHYCETHLNKIAKEYQTIYETFDMEYFSKLCNLFGINMKTKFYGLSTGYKTIFKNILVLSSNKAIMIFDEPVLGLDANHRDLFYKTLLEKYSETNNTIIISTHLIDEIASFVENLVIIKNGKLEYEGSAESLLNKSYVLVGSAGEIDKIKLSLKVIKEDENLGIKTIYVLDEKAKNIKTLDTVTVAKLSLQEIFVKLTD